MIKIINVNSLNIEASPLFFYENLMGEDTTQGHIIALRYGLIIANSVVKAYDYFDELIMKANLKICNKIFLFIVIEVALNRVYISKEIDIQKKRNFYKKCVLLTEVLSDKMKDAVCSDVRWYLEHTSLIHQNSGDNPDIIINSKKFEVTMDDNILQSNVDTLIENRMEILAVKNDKISKYLSDDDLTHSDNMIDLVMDDLSIHGKMFIIISTMLFNNLINDTDIDYNYIRKAIRVINEYGDGESIMGILLKFIRFNDIALSAANESFNTKPLNSSIQISNRKINDETKYRCETIIDHIKYDSNNRYEFDDTLSRIYFKRNGIKDVFMVNEAYFAEIDGNIICPIVDKELGDSLRVIYERDGRIVCSNK